MFTHFVVFFIKCWLSSMTQMVLWIDGLREHTLRIKIVVPGGKRKQQLRLAIARSYHVAICFHLYLGRLHGVPWWNYGWSVWEPRGKNSWIFLGESGWVSPRKEPWGQHLKEKKICGIDKSYWDRWRSGVGFEFGLEGCKPFDQAKMRRKGHPSREEKHAKVGVGAK